MHQRAKPAAKRGQTRSNGAERLHNHESTAVCCILVVAPPQGVQLC